MQFQVPQFIEVEDKIFGPFTFKQFIYIFGGLGAGYIIYRVLPIYIAGPLILAELGLATALAFFQYNGLPFIQALENAFFYVTRSKLYLWDNKRKPTAVHQVIRNSMTSPTGDNVYVPGVSDSRLHELAWSLDIKERIAAGVGAPEERGTDSVMPIRTLRDALPHK